MSLGCRLVPPWIAPVVVAVILVGTACGSTSADRVDTPTASEDTATPTTAPQRDSSTTAPPAAAEGSPDLQGLERCDDVPELTAGTEGSLDQFSNPDDDVVGVLVTYGHEHRDTYAGFWIDRDKGGALVMAFTDDPAPHLDAILARGPLPTDVEVVSPRPPITDSRPLGERDDVVIDVVQAEFTEAELMAANDEFWRDPPPYVLSGGTSTTRNRMTIDLIDPTADQLADLVTRLDMEKACLNVTITPTPPSGPLDVLPRGDTDLTCGDGGGPGFPASALEDKVLATDVDDPAARALIGFMADPPPRSAMEDIEQRPPVDGWFVLTIDDATAVFGHGDGPPYVAAFLERSNDGWRLKGWTIRCAPVVPLPEGLGVVEVTLDPDHPRPEPSDTTIHLRVSERACVSGQAMGDRLRGPQLEESDDQILIAFAVESLFGPATCPGNPPEAVTVELDASLGDRAIRNGLVYPPADIDFPVAN